LQALWSMQRKECSHYTLLQNSLLKTRALIGRELKKPVFLFNN
jgi:hypothetical protein